jgi:hypothetical protein
MNVFVVVYGLIGLVAVQPDPGKVMALLLDTHHMRMANGMPAMQHHPQIGLYTTKEGEDGETLVYERILGVTGEDFGITGLTQGPLDMVPPETVKDGERRLLFFNQLLTRGKAVVAPGCVGDDPHAECVADRRSLLGGRLVLSGQMAVRPIELVIDREGKLVLEGTVSNELWGFRSLATGRPIGNPQPYSSAVVFAGHASGDAHLEIGSRGVKVRLKTADPDTCGLLRAATGSSMGPCALVLVTNAPYHQESPEPVFEDHTELLAKIFADPGNPLSAYRFQWQPPAGPGNPPGNRCIHGFLDLE